MRGNIDLKKVFLAEITGSKLKLRDSFSFYPSRFLKLIKGENVGNSYNLNP